MKLYQVQFEDHDKTYYVVGRDPEKALIRAFTRALSDVDGLPGVGLVLELCDAKDLVLDILDEKGKDREKTSWKDGQLHFTCPKCKHTKRELRYVQPSGETGHVTHDTTDGGCGPKCFKGEHLHVICCDCGHRQWDYCAGHVEAPAPESGDKQGEAP